MKAMEMLEDEGYRRAIDGVAKPIFQQGLLLGERRIRSERMLKLLLVANEFEKFRKPEVPPLEPGQEPGRKEFLAKLNAIYAEDAELRQACQEEVVRNCDRRHAERMAELRRRKAPPCTHTAFGGEGMAPPYGEDTEMGRPRDTESADCSDQLSVNSNQSPATEQLAKDPEAGEGGVLDHASDHALDHALDHDQSGKAPARAQAAFGSKAPPCAGGKTAAQDKSKIMKELTQPTRVPTVASASGAAAVAAA